MFKLIDSDVSQEKALLAHSATKQTGKKMNMMEQRQNITKYMSPNIFCNDVLQPRELYLFEIAFLPVIGRRRVNSPFVNFFYSDCIL